MCNIITGQSTYDIISIINFHNINRVNPNIRELVRDRNVRFNNEHRREFNHNFNRNKYVRSK